MTMTTLTRALWTAALLLATGTAAAAQTARLPLEEGTRVRVHGGNGLGRLEGQVATWNQDTLWLATSEPGAPRPLSFAALRQIDVYRGRDTRGGALRGAAWGAFVGLGLGGVTASAAAPADAEFGPLVAQRAGVGAVLGAAVGAGLGALFLAERWQPFRVTPGSLR